MKKALKIVAILVVIGLIAIQFIRHDRTTPPVVDADTMSVSMQVPSQVDAILKRSCSDCHSDQTVYPWYAQVAPVSWWLDDHISEARREVNMSVWNTYSPKKKAKKLEEMCQQVESGEMPLPSYLWIHRDAVLKEGEARTICEWANAERARLNGSAPTS